MPSSGAKRSMSSDALLHRLALRGGLLFGLTRTARNAFLLFKEGACDAKRGNDAHGGIILLSLYQG